jgi:NADPH:quinone reductase-like Zn-dependent oxidoreductase
MKLSSVVEGGHFLWVQDEVIRPLESNYVEVEVEFVGLRAPASSRTAHDSVVMPNLAHEAVGVVSRCGSHVKSVVPGQRVVVFGTEACKTHIRQDESLVAAVPAGLLSEEAAALPGVFVTAQYVLVEIAGLSHGQTVLIHNAASALGQAAVQVSQAAGVEVFALVESKTEKSVLVERYGISPTHIFDSNRQHFVPAVDQATNSRGVDVVLCSRPGPAVLPSLATLGNSGYFFDLGASNADSPQVILPPSKHNASLIRVDMNWVQQAKAHIVKKLFQRTFDGPIAAIHPTNVFSVSNAKQAMDALNIQQHGTVVLSIDSEASVLTLPPPADRLHLDEGATYVLAGGLGVLGLNIANMMADHGAKHLVFLSRSGGSKNEEDLKRFQHRGILAEAFKCDVSDVNNVAEVFNKLRSEGRLVKGLIQ